MDPFEALADPIRRDLVRRLVAGPARVVDLTAAYDVTRPAVSRHLRLLAEAGVVSAEERGRERHYRLDTTGLEPVRHFLDEVEATGAPPAPPRFGDGVLDALETEVRRTRRDRRARKPTETSREDAG